MNTPIKSQNLQAAAMWGSPGRRYDEVSRWISSGIEHCVERLAPMPDERVLDVATGTGWTSRRVAARGAKVTGIDIAEGMLDAAKEIAAEGRLDIDYQLADAEALPFEDGEFDAVISTCGVMFAPERETAASELARVCRNAGRLALLCWTPDSNAVELRNVLAPFSPHPPSLDAPPPPSPFDWGRPEWLEETLGDVFDLGFERGTLYHRVPDGSAGWEVMASSFGPVHALAEALDDEGRTSARVAIADFYEQYKDGLGITAPYNYLVALGVRR